MKVNNALDSLCLGQALAASLAPSTPELLAWVGVYPLDISRKTTQELLKNKGLPRPLSEGTRVYRIRRFEVERRLIEQDASIAEPELKNKSDLFAYGDEDLISKLREIGISLDHLTLPYKSNYPI